MPLTDAEMTTIAKRSAAETLAVLWNQMADVAPTIRQGDVGDVIGQTYNKAGDLQSKVAAIGAALAQILGPDHPATAALSASPVITVEDMVRIAPQVTAAEAVRVISAFAARLTTATTTT